MGHPKDPRRIRDGLTIANCVKRPVLLSYVECNSPVLLRKYELLPISEPRIAENAKDSSDLVDGLFDLFRTE